MDQTRRSKKFGSLVKKKAGIAATPKIVSTLSGGTYKGVPYTFKSATLHLLVTTPSQLSKYLFEVFV